MTALELLGRSVTDARSAWQRWLMAQRWFGGKSRAIERLTCRDWACVDGGPPTFGLAWLHVDYRDQSSETYLLPLSLQRQHGAEARDVIAVSDETAICDASSETAFARAWWAGLATEAVWPAAHGRVFALPTAAFARVAASEPADISRLGGEQSNTTIRYGSAAVLKLLRKAAAGVNLDAEVLGFLNRRGFPHAPRLYGEIRYDSADGADDHTVAVLAELIPHQADGWTYAVRQLTGLIAGAADASATRLLADIEQLGAVTAALHLALASDDADPDFRPEPITSSDVAAWQEAMRRQYAEAEHMLARMRVPGPPLRADGALDALAALDTLADGRTHRIRVHGDYHLGQVLKTNEGFVILDFEGEPARPLSLRRAKACALKDVAGMLRSFSYAASVAFQERSAGRSDHARRWEQQAAERFVDAYCATARPGQALFLPRTQEAVRGVLNAFLIEKAAYELAYEADNRPDWLSIPLHGLRRLVAI